jgi:hypothetical protein
MHGCPLVLALKPKHLVFNSLDSRGWPPEKAEEWALQVESVEYHLPSGEPLRWIVWYSRLRRQMKDAFPTAKKVTVVFDPSTIPEQKLLNQRWLSLMDVVHFLRTTFHRDSVQYEVEGLENLELRLNGALGDASVGCWGVSRRLDEEEIAVVRGALKAEDEQWLNVLADGARYDR